MNVPADPVDLHRYRDVCHLFGALSSPARAATIHVLSRGERTVSELVELLEISQPLMSQHLRSLREAHLVVGRREGRSMYYRLADDHVAHVFLDALTHVEHDIVSLGNVDPATGTDHTRDAAPLGGAGPVEDAAPFGGAGQAGLPPGSV